MTVFMNLLIDNSRPRGWLNLFSRSELLIESEACSAESIEARSAECRSDVAPNARAARADANLDQGLYLLLCMHCSAGTRIID